MQSDPEWIAIQKKYKNDKDKLAQEQMSFYKEERYQPICFLFANIDPISHNNWLVPEHYPDNGKRSSADG